MNKYLIVKGVGGVGNRFISLMKAIQYTNKTGRVLYLDWCDGMFGPTGENIFFKYFQLSGVNYITSSEKIMKIMTKGKSTIFPRNFKKDDVEKALLKNFYANTPWVAKFPIYKVGMGLIFRHKFSYLLGLQSFQRVDDKKGYLGVLRDAFKGDNFPLGAALRKRLKEDIVVFADFRPYCDTERLFDYIKLKEIYLNQFQEYAKQNAFENAIGVHVRYTDKKPKAQLSKLYKKLKIDLGENKKLKVFLCTDNNEIIKEFNEMFPNKVIFFDKEIPETNEGGIHRWAYKFYEEDKKEQLFFDCLADMWLLSMTKKLYWQGNSSFSLISKQIKNDTSTTFDWLKF